MAERDSESLAPKFITLGPEGTDHERATSAFIDFQGLNEVAEVELVYDLALEGLEKVRTEPNSFLVQCSAHGDTNTVNMRYPQEVTMLAVFMYATKELGLIARKGIEKPKSLGLMPATRAYLLDMEDWRDIPAVNEPSKPVVAENLVRGKYDAGITSVECARKNPEILEVVKSFGKVMTSWAVYGRSELSYPKDVFIGHINPGLFTGAK